MVIVFLFLGNIRSTIIIGIAIPVALLTSFCMLYFCGYTLNMLTLGALALSVGMIVDNSTVVLENIYRHRSLGKGRYRAAVEGAQEVTGAVLASTLTTVAVYLPMVFITGMASEMMVPFAMTICFTIVASLLVSVTAVPMMASKWLVLDANLTKSGIRGAFSRMSHRYINWFDRRFGRFVNVYGVSLEKALNHKKTTLLIVTGALIGSFCLIPIIGAELMPSQDSGQVSVEMELPSGTKLEQTWEAAEAVQ